MKFSTIKEVLKAVKYAKTKSPFKKVHYPILLKKAIMVFMHKKDMSIANLAEQIEINYTTIYTWKKQYDDGLYELEGAYSVSPRSKEVNEGILKKLKQQMTELSKQISLVEQLEEMGYQVSKVEELTKLRAVK